MPRNRHLAIVQAGGQGSRMDVLTRERAKPALPFAGSYRLIDIVMSNLYHSGVDRVWLCVQHQASTLAEQVANGRPWDLDRTREGMRIVGPEQGAPDEHGGFATGNADQLFRIKEQIVQAQPDVVIVLSADHVYTFDVSEAVETHRATGAECTLVTTTRPRSEAGHHMTVKAATNGRVSRVDDKPEEPTTEVVSAEITVYDPQVLRDVLQQLHHDLRDEAEAGDTGLGDFGEHLIPAMVARGKTFAHAMTGYWRDVGRPEAYVAAHRELLLDDEVAISTREWPILTRSDVTVPARVRAGALVEDSLLCAGAQVSGTVRRSVIGPGVVVEAGAEVADSVLFERVVIRRGAHVRWAVADAESEVCAVSVGGSPAKLPARDADITLIGRDCVVTAAVARGARLEPGTTGATRAIAETKPGGTTEGDRHDL